MEGNSELTVSPLCRSVIHEGCTVRVEIYRGGTSRWLLEVVDERNDSMVWDRQFDTDQLAWAEFQRAIAEGELRSVIGDPMRT